MSNSTKQQMEIPEGFGIVTDGEFFRWTIGDYYVNWQDFKTRDEAIIGAKYQYDFQHSPDFSDRMADYEAKLKLRDSAVWKPIQ